MSCVGFLCARSRRVRARAPSRSLAALSIVAGAVAVADRDRGPRRQRSSSDGPDAQHRAVRHRRARSRSLTALALLLLGARPTCSTGAAGRLTRWLATGAAAIGGSRRAIGFLLGVPLFYGAVALGPDVLAGRAVLGRCWRSGFGAAHPQSATARCSLDRGLVGRFARRVAAGGARHPGADAARSAWRPRARAGSRYSVAAWVMTLTRGRRAGGRGRAWRSPSSRARSAG